MPRPTKGQKTPGSGRQPGTVNKKNQDLLAKCEAKGIDVFEALLEIAMDPEDENRFNCLKELAKYLYPQRKAIEHTVDENGFKVIIQEYKAKE